MSNKLNSIRSKWREFDLYINGDGYGNICENSEPWTPDSNWGKPDIHVIEHAAYTAVAEELRAAKAEIETLRLQLAGCGVAAMCNTEESRKSQAISADNPYWSASYQNVVDAVTREIAHRDKLQSAEARISKLREALEAECMCADNDGLPVVRCDAHNTLDDDDRMRDGGDDDPR